MPLKYANGERLLETYEYNNVSIKQKGRKAINISRSLIITSRRIINEVVSENSVDREEIPVTAATYVSTSYRFRDRPIALLICAIIFAIIGVVGIVLGKNADSMDLLYYILGGVFLFFGILFFILFLTSRRGTSVTLQIATDKGITPLLSIGALVFKGKSRGKNKVKSIVVSVDREVASRLVDNIGATLIEAKALATKRPATANPAATAPVTVESKPVNIVVNKTTPPTNQGGSTPPPPPPGVAE